MKDPVLLVIDSSTEALCLAACAQGRSVTWSGSGGSQASALLLPRARGMLEELDTTWRELDAVAFARGPGAFTGLRTACAAAQGLALGAGCGVLPLDSLMIVAEAARAARPEVSDEPVVGIAMDARMGELYAGRYQRARRDGTLRWQVLDYPSLLSPNALRARWQHEPPTWFAGSGIGMVQAAGLECEPEICFEDVSDAARARAMLTLALIAWHAHELRPPEDALPLYVRDKVAQTVAERAAQAANRGSEG